MNPSEIHTWLQIGVIVVTIGVGVWRLGYVFRKNVDDLKDEIQADYNERFIEMEKKMSEKTNRIYERFDEYKDLIENSKLPMYVSKEVYNVQHGSLLSVMDDMKKMLVTLEVKIDDIKDRCVAHRNGGAK